MPARTTTIARSDSRRRFIIAVATFLLVSFLVIRTSDAAFTATHVNEDNQFTTAEIDLDSLTDVPLFGTGTPDSVADATDLIGGDSVDACIDIEYTGSLDASDLNTVELAIAGTPNALSAGLSVTVERLDSCGDGNVQATVAAGGLLSVADADTGWTPATDGDSRGFRFTVEVDDDNDLQGESLDDVTITWSLETS